MNPKRISSPVRTKDRAGRAPYNFVPLPEQPWQSVPEPPSHAFYDEQLQSGEIEIELLALTDFYIRGMWKLDKYLEFSATGEKKKPPQPRPFEAAGKEGNLRLPGSSLRGMFRALIEILSGAPLDPVNDDHLFYRTVASVADPSNLRSFEPHAKVYKSRVLDAHGNLKVCAGYLYNTRDSWTIRPASSDKETGRQWYRYRSPETWIRKPVTYEARGDSAHVFAGAPESGWQVCSGHIGGKSKQWVIRAEDPEAAKIEIPPEDVEAYKKGGITDEIRSHQFEFTDLTQKVPCFYVKWKKGGKDRVAFGHTAYFRMPYATKITGRIPNANSRAGRELEWDMARAIFGWAPRPDKGEIDNNPDPLKRKDKAWRGRVFFEDALLREAPNSIEAKTRSVILGEPKPTTFQHYLVQPDDPPPRIFHWDGDLNTNNTDQVCVRGHKLYWHRANAELPKADPTKKASTQIQLAKAGAVFRTNIRYENLRAPELGALLAAIELRPGCHHRLGMGKPLGLGSFAIRIAAIKRINRPARYGSLFAGGKLTTGYSGELDCARAKDVFAKLCLNNRDKTIDDLWNEPRSRELKALLTWDIPAAVKNDWLSMTRYLEFGRLPANLFEGRNYNEYNEIGAGEPGFDRPRLSKRRPLPPAMQVLQGGSAIPKTPRPPFTETSEKDRPRRPLPGRFRRS